ILKSCIGYAAPRRAVRFIPVVGNGVDESRRSSPEVFSGKTLWPSNPVCFRCTSQAKRAEVFCKLPHEYSAIVSAVLVGTLESLLRFLTTSLHAPFPSRYTIFRFSMPFFRHRFSASPEGCRRW